MINSNKYRIVSSPADKRYIEALSVVDDPTPANRPIGEITEPAVINDQSREGFNLAVKADVKLFISVLDGESLVRGFGDIDIRSALYGMSDEKRECLR